MGCSKSKAGKKKLRERDLWHVREPSMQAKPGLTWPDTGQHHHSFDASASLKKLGTTLFDLVNRGTQQTKGLPIRG